MINFNIIVNNKAWYKYFKNPNGYLENKIKKFNKKFKKFKNNDIFCTLLLSGSAEIKKLNKKFRKKNNATDVLSFPFYNKKEFQKILKNEKEIYLGDIIINISKIESKNNKKKFLQEFNKLWIHGLAHLFGYNHIKDKEFLKMLKVEKKFLSYLN